MYERQYPNSRDRGNYRRTQPFDEWPNKTNYPEQQPDFQQQRPYGRANYQPFRTGETYGHANQTLPRFNQQNEAIRKPSNPDGDYWYTPEPVLESVRNILHDYFDPCPIAAEFNGLEMEWTDICFINPPFSLFKEFVQKGLQEWTPNKTFVWLVNADFKNETATAMASMAKAIAITRNPIQFRPGHSSLKSVGNPWNSVFILWTTDEQIATAFTESLSGDCIVLKK